jgi:hypothetical protein
MNCTSVEFNSRLVLLWPGVPAGDVLHASASAVLTSSEEMGYMGVYACCAGVQFQAGVAPGKLLSPSVRCSFRHLL